jgi:hypothetical protein
MVAAVVGIVGGVPASALGQVVRGQLVLEPVQAAQAAVTPPTYQAFWQLPTESWPVYRYVPDDQLLIGAEPEGELIYPEPEGPRVITLSEIAAGLTGISLRADESVDLLNDLDSTVQVWIPSLATPVVIAAGASTTVHPRASSAPARMRVEAGPDAHWTVPFWVRDSEALVGTVTRVGPARLLMVFEHGVTIEDGTEMVWRLSIWSGGRQVCPFVGTESPCSARMTGRAQAGVLELGDVLVSPAALLDTDQRE